MLSTLLLDALFPDACLVCLSPREEHWRHELACDECLDRHPLPLQWQCSACELPRTACHAHPEASHALLATPGERTPHVLAHALLYENIQRSIPPLAELMGLSVVRLGLSTDQTLCIALPEFTHEVRERGYSANELLATDIGSILHIPTHTTLLTKQVHVSRTLYDLRDLPPQTPPKIVLVVGVQLPTQKQRAQLTTLLSTTFPRTLVYYLAAVARTSWYTV
jgi:predicted amidophosphoribosyltransferase